MDYIRYGNADYTVTYVDPSIATAGTGETPATAIKNLPAAASLISNTCYLIRRTAEASFCNLPNGTFSGQRVMFLGMPLPTDSWYKFVPAAAVQAWNSDTATYANIKVVTDYQFTISNAAFEGLFYRLYSFRKNDNTGGSWMYYFNSDSHKGVINFENCLFGCEGVNLHDPNFTSTTPFTNKRLNCYVRTNYYYAVSFRNCIQNFGMVNNYGYGWYSRSELNYTLENIKVNALPGSDQWTGYRAIVCQDNYGYYLQNLFVSNIEMEMFMNGTHTWIPGFVSCSQHSCYNARIENVKSFESEKYFGSKPTQWRLLDSPHISFTELYSWNIFNIEFNFPSCWRSYGTNANAIEINVSSNGDNAGYDTRMSKLRAYFAEENGIGDYNPYSEANYDNAGYWYFYAAIRIGCDRRIDQAHWRLPSVSDVIATNPRGKGLGLCNVFMEKDIYCKGTITAYGTGGTIDSVETWYPGFAFKADSYTSIRIKDIKVNKECPDVPYTGQNSFWLQNWNNFIYVDTCNTDDPFDTTLSNGDYDNKWALCCNNAGSPGRFIQRGGNCLVDTWDTHRTGGKDVSLRFTNTQRNSDPFLPLKLGKWPFKGMTIPNPATTGVNVLNVYLALSGIPETLQDGLMRQISIDITGKNGHVSSFNYGQWLDDDSEWSSENLVGKKLRLPIDVAADDELEMAIQYYGYTGSGAIFLDPLPVWES